MKKIQFPERFVHKHPPVVNVNDILKERRTMGQVAADKVAALMGSWKFLIIQSIVLAGWIILNITAYINHWDPYPFILMNLVLSMQAAYAAPVIMMSQNRQAERDRLEAHNDYQVNLKAEEEVRTMLNHLEAQSEAIANIQEALASILKNGNTPNSEQL